MTNGKTFTVTEQLNSEEDLRVLNEDGGWGVSNDMMLFKSREEAENEALRWNTASVVEVKD